VKSFLDPPRPLRLRRLAVLRVMLRPRAAARALAVLADDAEMNRRAVGTALRACAVWHEAPRLYPSAVASRRPLTGFHDRARVTGPLARSSRLCVDFSA
jgi:hypothetical protein